MQFTREKLHSIKSQSDFRLFLTCENNPRLPSALVRASEVLIAEASTGVKANIQRFYYSVSKTRIDRALAERSRLYRLLPWFHAIIQERLRYVLLGWTKRYEFGEVDANCALKVIDHWVDNIATAGDSNNKLRPHVDPKDLHWQAFRTLIYQSLYGRRVDDSFDQVMSL